MDFFNDQVISEIRSFAENDLIAGYTYQDLKTIDLNVEDQKTPAIAIELKQPLFPFFNDERQNYFVNAELIIFVSPNNGAFIYEGSYFNDSLTAFNLLNSLPEYIDNPVNHEYFDNLIPNVVDNRIGFNRLQNTLFVPSNVSLPEIILNINVLLGARNAMLTFGILSH